MDELVGLHGADPDIRDQDTRVLHLPRIVLFVAANQVGLVGPIAVQRAQLPQVVQEEPDLPSDPLTQIVPTRSATNPGSPRRMSPMPPSTDNRSMERSNLFTRDLASAASFDAPFAITTATDAFALASFAMTRAFAISAHTWRNARSESFSVQRSLNF